MYSRTSKFQASMANDGINDAMGSSSKFSNTAATSTSISNSNSNSNSSSTPNAASNPLTSANGYNGQNQNHSKSQSHQNFNDTRTSTKNIAENKDGKRYTMEQVFQVWYDNKDKILNSEVKMNGHENYKLAVPEPIYHLLLQEQNELAKQIQGQGQGQGHEQGQGQGQGQGKSQPQPHDSSSVPDGKSVQSDAIPTQDEETAKFVAEKFDNLKLGASMDQQKPLDAQDLFGSFKGVNSIGILGNNDPALHANNDGFAQRSLLTEFPPGLVNPATTIPLLTSDKIEWHYIDPSGNEQGPFNGDMMQEWFTGGYLDLSLMIKRVGEKEFKPLRTLCDSVQNYTQPFKIPLPDLTAASDLLLGSRFDGSQTNTNSLDGNGIRLPSSSNFLQSMFAGSGFLNSSTPTTASGGVGGVSGVSGVGGATAAANATSTGGSSFQNIHNQPLGNVGNIGSAFDQSFGLPSMPSLLQQQILQQQKPLLSRNNSGWALDTSSQMVGGLGTPTSATPTSSSFVNSLGNTHNIGSGTPQLSQPTPMSPWMTASNGVGQISRISSPFVSTTNLSNSFGQTTSAGAGKELTGKDQQGFVDDEEDEDDHDHSVLNAVVTDILQDEPEAKQETSTNAGNSKAKMSPSSASHPSAASSSSPTTTTTTTTGANKREKSATSKSTTEPKKAFTNSQEEITVPPTKTVDLKPASSKKQDLAPWAAKAKAEEEKAKANQLSLKEIQKVEAERLSQQKKLQEKAKAEQAQKAWAVAAAAEKAAQLEQEKLKVQLPPTWATAATNEKAAPVKSLAEIQKEEAELAKAKNAAAAAAAAAQAVTGATAATAAAAAAVGGVGASNAYPTNMSFANALANSVPREDTTAWTTVASSKKPTVAKKQPSIATTSTGVSTSKVTPQLLRSVSATKPSATGINFQAIREDFLVWARSQMTNLYPSVSKNDLLEMFITLPISSSDTPQLISESIYASSATMDGRRFAQEFVKRKNKADQMLGVEGARDYTSWSAAILSSADKVQTVDEDGWSTSVKSKKKGGKKQ
ncbi:GYF domain-containing protein [Acetobacter pasteurianus]|nr:GYF domain-containing protein [Acetobacter pasteurianus]